MFNPQPKKGKEELNMSVTIGRSQEGITINDLEFILDENGEVKMFKTKESAIKFLSENGVYEIDNLTFIEV